MGVAAWYAAEIARFCAASTHEVLGALSHANPGDLVAAQRRAWEVEVGLLRAALADVHGHMFLEFDVPRLGSRIDAIVVSGAAVVPIEFKVGESTFRRTDHDQVWDYALDLRNFHRGSHAVALFPVLVATEASKPDLEWRPPHADGVRPPRHTHAEGLRAAVIEAIAAARGPAIDGEAWGRAPYQPTPTIVQAARLLYASHSVDAIARSDAGARNLGATSRAVEQVIADAQRCGHKAIVFVTGVPGAGKTLVGLNIATRHRRAVEEDPIHAVYLSGNAPLVKVLQEALTRDETERLRRSGAKVRKGDVRQRVKPFLQNVHHFRDEGLRTDDAPFDDVVVFDEAQRAWNQAKTARFMKTRKKLHGFSMSEPEFQLSYMDRRPDWAVAVCLVGGGQEIHDGEAGIESWIAAARDRFPHWHIHLSPRLTESEYGAGAVVESVQSRPRVHFDEDLHLATSMRSFRAEHVSGFVKAALDCDVDVARQLYTDLHPRYPLVLTRDLARAKDWVRQQARGSERFGLVASSQAERLKPHAIDIRAPVDPVHWFLDECDDTRSSLYLEDAATEFQVQGLELDWVCVTWDADLRMADGGWAYRKFHGSRWKHVRQPELQRYMVNAYRVLLTRARQGMVVCVPPGDARDPTRRPEFYDRTFDYLTSLGIEQV